MGLRGFMYDFNRFLRFNAWNFKCSNAKMRQYHLAKLTHTLEKSMSFKDKRAGAGYTNAKKIQEILIEVDNNNYEKNFNDFLALQTLKKFCLESKDADKKFSNIYQELPNWDDAFTDYGIYSLSKEEISRGQLESPEDFFNSRYTLRDFSSIIISSEIIDRALNLAQKTPSSCNMQPWHVYVLNNRENIDIALSYQTGNKGFTNNIHNLMIITSDQLSFISSSERYQHWIDGGLYAMSLIYAFHSLGIATCSLNWSENPKKDIAIRKVLNINEHHSIIMMIAFGYPCENNLVCVSPRKNIKNIKTEI
ncbi:MAG: nitroreductase family protein [Providencia rustigianii]|uniref:nitroreductase family protein n=1 Tax=Providencia rustigianii TaxID=158850 RepID=UPI003F2C3297